MDIAAQYVLTPPTGPPFVFNADDIFNGGVTDVAWLTDIKGLDSPALRTPQFKRPLAHGGYKPVPWLEEPLHPRFEGAFVIRSKPFGGDCRAERNVIYHALKACLRNCEDDPGQLAWTEVGVGDFELEVSYEVELAHGWDADYAVMTFTFGLFSEASQPVAA